MTKIELIRNIYDLNEEISDTEKKLEQLLKNNRTLQKKIDKLEKSKKPTLKPHEKIAHEYFKKKGRLFLYRNDILEQTETSKPLPKEVIQVFKELLEKIEKNQQKINWLDLNTEFFTIGHYRGGL